MKSLHSKRWLCLTTALLLPTAFVGCGNQEKTVAVVGEHTIKEKELSEKALTMRGPEIPLDMDAGAAGLTSLIKDQLLEQCVKTKGLTVSDEQVKNLNRYQDQFDVQSGIRMRVTGQTPEDFERSIRTSLLEFAIGTEGAKADPKKLEEEFNKLKTQPTGVPTASDPYGLTGNPVRRPEIFSIKMLRVPSLEAGKKIIEMLKKDGDFKKIARLLNPDPAAVSAQGNETPVSRAILKQQLPELEEALAKLGDGQITPEPIVKVVRNPAQPAQSQTGYFVGQIVKKYPAKDFGLEDVKTALEFRMVAQEHPEWITHKDAEVSKFTQQLFKDNKVQILAQKYQAVVSNFIKSMVASKATPQPTAPPQSGAGAGGSAPQPNGGGAAPSAGGAGASAPSPSAPAPSGGAEKPTAPAGDKK